MPETPEVDADRPDLLSAALDELRGGPGRHYRSRLPSRWSLSFPPSAGWGFHVLLRGRARLWLAGEVHDVVAGELVLLPRGEAHTIGEHGRGVPVAVPQEASRDADWTGGAPVAAELVCGELILRDSPLHPLLRSLPPLLRVPADGPVGSVLALLQSEAVRTGGGGAAMVSRLVEVLTLHAIRTWVTRPDAPRSWVTGARDPGIARALAAIHTEPARPWSVASLARVAGQSRSRFSERFRGLVGTSPARYLRELRLRAAAAALADGDRVGQVAHAGGYASAAAFSRAFKRATGRAPRETRSDPRG